MSTAREALRLLCSMQLDDALLAQVARALPDNALAELVREVAPAQPAAQPAARAPQSPRAAARRSRKSADGETKAAVLKALRAGAATVPELAARSGCTVSAARSALLRLRVEGLAETGGGYRATWSLAKRATKAAPPAADAEDE